MIRSKPGESAGLQQRFALQKYLILPTSKHIGHDCTPAVIDRMSPPPLVLLLPDTTPHHIYLDFTSALTLCAFTEHSAGTDAQHRRGTAYPTRIETHVNDVLLHLRPTALVVVVQRNTSRAHTVFRHG
jgi:hypothetical protein